MNNIEQIIKFPIIKCPKKFPLKYSISPLKTVRYLVACYHLLSPHTLIRNFDVKMVSPPCNLNEFLPMLLVIENFSEYIPQ